MPKSLSSVAALAFDGDAGSRPADGALDIEVAKDIRVSAAGKTHRIATVAKVGGIAWFDRVSEGVQAMDEARLVLGEGAQGAWIGGERDCRVADLARLVAEQKRTPAP